MNISNSIYNVSKVSNSSFDYMLYNYRNITSPLTQSIMILLTALITVLGLAGNSLVVFATTRYRSFRMDAVSITLIRHLALSDILFIVVQVIPNCVNHIAGGNYLGDTVCRVAGLLRYLPIVSNMAFITLISAYRLFVLYSPFSALLLAKRSADTLSIIVWVLSTVPSVVALAHGTVTFFEPQIGLCDAYLASLSKGWYYSLLGVLILSPFVTIVSSNIGVWVYVLRMSKKMQSSTKQACITSATITTLFVASWGPNIALYIVAGHSLALNRVAATVYSLNTVMNPLVYTFVNRNFKDFVLKLVGVQSDRHDIVVLNRINQDSSDNNLNT